MMRGFPAFSLYVLIAFVAAACADSYTAWHYPSANVEGTFAVPGEIDSQCESRTVARVALPKSKTRDISVYIGDITGGKGPEIIVIDRTYIAGYSLSGHRLFINEAAEREYVEGLLYDFDYDGKEDIVVGTSGATSSGFRVYNGFGALIGEYFINAEGENYLIVEPELVLEGQLYLVAKEGWHQNPRSVVAFCLENRRIDWTFYVPSRPEALTPLYPASGEANILVSQQTQRWGGFSLYGLKKEKTFGFDSTLQLLVIRPDGSTEKLLPVNVNGAPISGFGNFLSGPESNRSVLLHVESQALHLVDTTSGTVTASIKEPDHELVDMRVLGKDDGYLALFVGSDGWLLKTYDTSMREVHNRVISAVDVVLGPVLVDSNGRFSSLLMAIDSDLHLLSPGLDTDHIATISPPTIIAATLTESSATVAAAGEFLEIVYLTW